MIIHRNHQNNYHRHHRYHYHQCLLLFGLIHSEVCGVLLGSGWIGVSLKNPVFSVSCINERLSDVVVAVVLASEA